MAWLDHQSDTEAAGLITGVVVCFLLTGAQGAPVSLMEEVGDI
jgi:hypothetical protein